MKHPERWIPVLLIAAAAVLVMYPLSIYPGMVHRTPNTPLHLLVLDHLVGFLRGDVHDLSHVIAADYPTGRPVRIIGWPMHLIAVPLQPLLGRVAALNLSLLALVFTSGLLFARLLARMELGVGAQTVGALAWVLNPLLVSFLSNGQYENHVGWAFPLVLLGLMRGGGIGHLAIGLGLLGAAFSSPYQAIPVALVLLCVLPIHPQRSWSGLTVTLAVVMAACYLYFSGPQPTPGGECGPTSGTMPLVLSELLGWTGDIPPLLPPRPDRWTGFVSMLNNPVTWSSDLGLHHLVVAPGSGFLGLIPLVGGAIGLWLFRATPWVRPLLCAGGASAILALGPDLAIRRGMTLDIPMPADLLSWLPGISQMGTTLRFTTGLAFVLVVGLAFGVDWGLRWIRQRSTHAWVGPLVLVLLVVALMGEWLFRTVSPVPFETRSYTVPEGFAALPDEGAVMAVPVMEHVPPEAHLWMSAVHERPVVGYCSQSIIDYREQYALVNYAQGGALPDTDAVQADMEKLSKRGISYLAFIVAEPGADRWANMVLRIQRLLGPADALGDGVIGYRTAR